MEEGPLSWPIRDTGTFPQNTHCILAQQECFIYVSEFLFPGNEKTYSGMKV